MYHTLAQANVEPTKESYNNAKKFLVNIKEVIIK